MLRGSLLWGMGLIWLLSSGCVSVRVPDIRIETGPAPERIDIYHVPPTRTHEQARAELEKAYRHLRYLDQQVRQLRQKLRELQAEKRRLQQKLQELTDRSGSAGVL